jgi:hypothetical protein
MLWYGVELVLMLERGLVIAGAEFGFLLYGSTPTIFTHGEALAIDKSTIEGEGMNEKQKVLHRH